MTYEATVYTTPGDVAQFKAGAVVLLQGQSALDVPVNFSVATSKFTVNASTGAAVFAGAVSGITTLGVTGTNAAATVTALTGSGNATIAINSAVDNGMSARLKTTSKTAGGVSNDWFIGTNILSTDNRIEWYDGTATRMSLAVGGGLTVAGAISGITGSFSGTIATSNAAAVEIINTNNTRSAKLGPYYVIVSGEDATFGTTTVGKTTTITAGASAAIGVFSSTGLSVTGSVDASGGAHIGASATANAYISQSSVGSGTVTHYIGNQAITTSSDIRLKEDIVDSQRNATQILNSLRVVDHTWNDPSDTVQNNRNSRGVWTGLIAQEAVAHIPWLVNKPFTDVDAEGNPQYWHMDYGYAVPLLIKALQEQSTRIAALEAK